MWRGMRDGPKKKRQTVTSRDGSDSFEPEIRKDSDDLCDLDCCCVDIRRTDREVHQSDHNDRKRQSRD